MRKYLTSTTAMMAAILVVLAAIGIWIIVTAEGDEQADEPAADVTKADEEEPAVGGGPADAPEAVETEEPGDTEAAGDELDDEASPRLDEPMLDEPDLDKPDLEDDSSVEAFEDEQETPEPPEPPQVDDEDQESAYRADDAPEAEILDVVPPDEPTSEGGGPVGEETPDEESRQELDGPQDEAQAPEDEEDWSDDEETADEETPQDEEGADEEDGERAQPQRVEDLMRDLDREEGGGASPDDPQTAPIPPPEQPAADEPAIDRPSLRRAPAPSRPGEEDDE